LHKLKNFATNTQPTQLCMLNTFAQPSQFLLSAPPPRSLWLRVVPTMVTHFFYYSYTYLSLWLRNIFTRIKQFYLHINKVLLTRK